MIRFLACSWSMSWEFDRPCMVLEPYIRYGFSSPKKLIEDLVIDMCVSLEKNTLLSDEDVSLEFQWRGWNLEELKHQAEAILRRNCTKLKYKNLIVYEEFYTFTNKNGRIIIEEVCPPKQCVF